MKLLVACLVSLLSSYFYIEVDVRQKRREAFLILVDVFFGTQFFRIRFGIEELPADCVTKKFRMRQLNVAVKREYTQTAGECQVLHSQLSCSPLMDGWWVGL